MIKNQNSVEEIIRAKKPSKLKKIALKFSSLFVVLIFFIAVALVFKGMSAWGKITVKNEGSSSPFLKFPSITPNALAGEGDGRINVLLMGVGGANHPGGNLTDTIIVTSVDPKNNTVAMLSIPRDLLVPLPEPLKGQEKINAVHSLGEQQKNKIQGGGPTLLKKTVTEILDLPIHYFIKVDFNGFTQLVNSLDGITVDVEKAIDDPFYPAPNMKDYSPFHIKAGIQKINGETALKFVRSRETTSDFDRAKRQQLALASIKDKSLTAGVLTNPKKISDIIETLGNHIQTDFTATEMERFLKIMKNIDSSNIITKVLDNSETGPLKNLNNGGYYLVPKTGDFKEIQRIAHEIFTDPYIEQENAKIAVLNGSGNPGLALQVADQLKAYNYNVATVETSPIQIEKTTIYDISIPNKDNSKQTTIELLKKRIEAQVSSQPAQEIIDTAKNADIIVVIGKDYSGGKKTK